MLFSSMKILVAMLGAMFAVMDKAATQQPHHLLGQCMSVICIVPELLCKYPVKKAIILEENYYIKKHCCQRLMSRWKYQFSYDH